MPVTDSTPDTTLERANELYWDSDRTVEEIVKALGVSRSALYSAIRPRDAATDCPECGDAMVFTNRSNREARAATCPGCATEAPAGDAPAAPSRASDPTASGPRAFSRWRGQLAAVPRERIAMVGAVAARAVREMM